MGGSTDDYVVSPPPLESWTSNVHELYRWSFRLFKDKNYFLDYHYLLYVERKSQDTTLPYGNWAWPWKQPLQQKKPHISFFFNISILCDRLKGTSATIFHETDYCLSSKPRRNLSTTDKSPAPNVSAVQRFHCDLFCFLKSTSPTSVDNVKSSIGGVQVQSSFCMALVKVNASRFCAPLKSVATLGSMCLY